MLQASDRRREEESEGGGGCRRREEMRSRREEEEEEEEAALSPPDDRPFSCTTSLLSVTRLEEHLLRHSYTSNKTDTLHTCTHCTHTLHTHTHSHTLAQLLRGITKPIVSDMAGC